MYFIRPVMKGKSDRMKFLCYLLIMAYILTGCYVSKNPMRDEVRRLQKGKVKEDTSYVYALPYEEGKAHYMVQGYFSSFTHRERAALDFKMKRGTKICAVREGVVIRLKEDGDRGGLKKNTGLMAIMSSLSTPIVQGPGT